MKQTLLNIFFKNNSLAQILFIFISMISFQCGIFKSCLQRVPYRFPPRPYRRLLGIFHTFCISYIWNCRSYISCTRILQNDTCSKLVVLRHTSLVDRSSLGVHSPNLSVLGISNRRWRVYPRYQPKWIKRQKVQWCK